MCSQPDKVCFSGRAASPEFAGDAARCADGALFENSSPADLLMRRGSPGLRQEPPTVRPENDNDGGFVGCGFDRMVEYQVLGGFSSGGALFYKQKYQELKGSRSPQLPEFRTIIQIKPVQFL